MSNDQTKPVDPGMPIEGRTNQAEDIAAHEDEAGRKDTGTQGPTNRPTGTSTARDYTSIDPNEPLDDDSPAG